MNYNPYGYTNYYPWNNNGSGNTYPQQMQQFPAQNQMMNPMQNQTQSPLQSQVQGLNGRFVDNQDIVRVTDVPYGGCAFFPRADLKEIYAKQWNQDGTTSIVTYRPVAPEVSGQQTEQGIDSAIFMQILDKVNTLEKKFDEAFSIPETPSQELQKGKGDRK